MPFRYYQCSIGHISEVLDLPKTVGKTTFTLSQLLKDRDSRKPKKLKCKTKDCNKFSKEIFLSRREARAARNFRPSLLYIHPKTGDVICPGRNNPDHLPSKYRKSLSKKGYNQIELTNFRDYERFQQDQRLRRKDQYDKTISKRQSEYDKYINEQIEALKQGGNIEMPNSDGTSRTISVPGLDKMTPSMRLLAEEGIRRAREHKVDGGFREPFIEAMEYEGRFYRDDDTDFKKRY